MLARILAQQVRTLNQRHSLGEYLLPPVADVPELAFGHGLGAAMVAKAMVWRNTPLASGDLIVVAGVFGLVELAYLWTTPRTSYLNLLITWSKCLIVLLLCSEAVSC